MYPDGGSAHSDGSEDEDLYHARYDTDSVYSSRDRYDAEYAYSTCDSWSTIDYGEWVVFLSLRAFEAHVYAHSAQRIMDRSRSTTTLAMSTRTNYTPNNSIHRSACVQVCIRVSLTPYLQSVVQQLARRISSPP